MGNLLRVPLKTNNGTRITQIIMMISIAIVIGNDFINENPVNQCYQRSICIRFVGFLEMPCSAT